jgi:hypothetical protein
MSDLVHQFGDVLRNGTCLAKSVGHRQASGFIVHFG